jgi:hypothetical protein
MHIDEPYNVLQDIILTNLYREWYGMELTSILKYMLDSNDKEEHP